MLHHSRFSELAETLRDAGVTAIDGVVFDIGVSSMQLDDPARGMSFRADGPLDIVLCVSNLSRFAQPAELPLQRWQGLVPIELLGHTPFPRIGELPYFVTLAPYGFYWFQLAEA